MNMNIINRIVLGAAAVGFAASCTANYLEINSNPYGVTDEEMLRDGYAVKSAFINMASSVISPDINTAQFVELLLGCDLAGYTAPANAKFNNTIANYNATDDWSRVLMASDRVIPLLFTNLKQLQVLTDDPIYLSVGDVIKVACMHRVTDAFGPIPYSKIGLDGEISVPYDSQEAVYRHMFDDLNAAIGVFENNRANSFNAASDPIYGGVVENWLRFANSLKLRLAMRISYADPALSKQMAEEAVKDGCIIESNSQNAMFSAWTQEGNSMRVAVRYNLASHDGVECTTGAGDSHAGADIICYMNGYNDPRREKYFTKSEWDGVDYVGLRHGIVIPDHNAVGHKYSGIFFENGANQQATWMNAAEVAFLRAEAAGVFGYDMGGDAETFYNEGIRLSFEQYGVSGAEEYLASTDVPVNTYIDPYGKNTYGSLLTQLPVAWNASADKEEMQERIMIQKYIANFLLGNESWADWRRTGYPHLIPASDDGNKSNGLVDSEKGARRMPYPLDESSNNSVNYRAAVSVLAGESSDNKGDAMSTRLWFDCKPNHPYYK